MRHRLEIACAVLLVLGLTACKGEKAPTTSTATTSSTSTTTTTTTGTTPTPMPPPTVTKIEATPEAVKKAQEDLQTFADRDRQMYAVLTFEDFKGRVHKEPFEGGKYIVNGDTPIANEKQLREFYDQHVRQPSPKVLILAQVNSMDQKWNQEQKKKLTYCVSNTFGAHHADVVQQMASATGEWGKWATVHYIYDASQDGNCVASNEAVVFDVRPVNVNGDYLARAFFPNEPRAGRNVLIDDSSFRLPPNEKLQLAGILRHELGHTLGFRHEQTRPESGTCFEDTDWKQLTTYDAFSVMHYPQCNGKGDWSLVLTDKDKNGVACVYGPNPPFAIDKTLIVNAAVCATDQTVAPPVGAPQTQTFSGQSVAQDKQKSYGPFPVAGGSPLTVKMGGAGATGDPDLYVRFGSQPFVHMYDCRPFVDGPNELCALTVPASAKQVFVMVRGFTAGTYELQITRVPPSAAPH